MLTLIGLVLAAANVAGAFVFLRRAPAVSVALVGGLVGGIVGFVASSANGPRGVPADVGWWVTDCLVAAGAVGLLVTRGRPPAARLRRFALTFLALSPVAAATMALLLLLACPLYVTRGSGLCYHDFDMLGGWITGVVVLFTFDLVVIAGLFFASAWQATRFPEPVKASRSVRTR